MTNVVNAAFGDDVGDRGSRDKVGYIMDADNKIIGASHADWPFDIVRDEDEIAFVAEDGQVFGALPRNEFNDVLITWLLIDSPSLIDDMANAEVVGE